MSTFSIRSTKLANADVNYVLLAPADIVLKREKRTGDWSDIGTGTGAVSASFFSAEIQHKIGASYAYALLPNLTGKELEAYAKKPNIVVVQNDGSAHVVKDTVLDVLAANVWVDKDTSLDGLVTTYNKMSIMLQKDSEGLKVALADPLQKQAKLSIAFKQPVLSLKDPKGRVTQVSLHRLDIDVFHLKGRGYVFTVKF